MLFRSEFFTLSSGCKGEQRWLPRNGSGAAAVGRWLTGINGLPVAFSYLWAQRGAAVEVLQEGVGQIPASGGGGGGKGEFDLVYLQPESCRDVSTLSASSFSGVGNKWQ